MKRLRWVSFPVLAVTVVAGAVGLLSVARGAHRPPSVKIVEAGSALRPQSFRPASSNRRFVAARLKDNFAVLDGQVPRRARAASLSAEPSAVQSLISGMALPDDPSNERQLLDVPATVEVQGASGPAWIVPGQNGSCVVTFITAATGPFAGQGLTYANCQATSSELSNGQLAIGREADGNHFLYGMVPNGNTSVQLTSPSGITQSVPVVDNVVTHEMPFIPTAIKLINASGAVVTSAIP